MGHKEDLDLLLSLVRSEKLQLGLKKEILYEGVYYDVSKFMEKHPGGEVIDVYIHSGEDATLPVQQFHNRAIKKVLAIMKSLPQRQATEEDVKKLGMDLEKQKKYKALTHDYLELFETLKNEGMFDPNPFHVFCRSSEVLFLCGLGFYLLGTYPLSLLTRIFGILSLGLGMGRSGYLMHEGAHHSLLGIPKWDRFISYFFFGIVNGLSNTYWKFQHNRHHSGPQHVKYDADMDSIPIVAFSKLQITQPGLDIFGTMRYQKLLWFPFIIPTIMWGWKLLRHPYYCYQQGVYFEFVLMALHYIIFVGCAGFWNYFFAVHIFAYYFIVSANLSHSHLPETEEPAHWVEYALVHTTNIRSSWWVDYYMGNLNYQIEHHLFPTMPQYKNKLCRDRVKALAKKHNIPYNLYSYSEALVKALNHLGDVAKEL